jgi:hypothetical protein
MTADNARAMTAPSARDLQILNFRETSAAAMTDRPMILRCSIATKTSSAVVEPLQASHAN